MATADDTPLLDLGARPTHLEAFAALGGEQEVLGRVVLEQRGVLTLGTRDGEREARISGRLRHRAAESELPVIGDWVIAEPTSAGAPLRIVECLPRFSSLSRKAAGETTRQQVVAANLDRVFCVMGLDGDFQLRRMERMITAVAQGGAEAVVVLNKRDLCDDLESRLEEVGRIAGDSPVLAISALKGLRVEQLEPYLEPRKTVALLGTSGVGKSTIVNALAGEELMRTGTVRSSDDRGKHTTSHRELLRLPGGGLLIDNPGIRELQLWDTSKGVDEGFEDILVHAADCRFRDCGHDNEPGCGVRAALKRGDLDPARFDNFLKLRRELENLARAQDARAKLEEKKKRRAIHRAVKKHRPRSLD